MHDEHNWFIIIEIPHIFPLSFKVHLTPNFFCEIESTCYLKHLGAKSFELAWILDFLCHLKVPLEVLHDRVLGSLGRQLLTDVCPGTKHDGASVCSLYLLEKWQAKLITPIYFGSKTSKFCLRIISFSSLQSELSFDSKNSEINFDRARSAT